MRENESERRKLVEYERERVGEQSNFKLFLISNYEIEFHKIHIYRGRERIVQPLKACLLKEYHIFKRNFDPLERIPK